MNKDDILSELIAQSSVEPALGRDILEATQWNLTDALAALSAFNVTHEEPSEAELHAEELAALERYSREHKEKQIKSDSVEKTSNVNSSKLRGMSFISPNVVHYFHKQAKMRAPKGSDKDDELIDETFFHHSFMLPDFSSYSEEFQHFLKANLIESSHLVNLQKSVASQPHPTELEFFYPGHLNWWAATGQCPKLTPLATSGDGNCLLHAVSLGMWGFHDRELLLRTLLYRLLTSTDQGAGIYRRWRFQIEKRNREAGGLQFSKEEWDTEWSEIVNISSCRDRNATDDSDMKDNERRGSAYRPNYESLEDVHVFALAHVIRRPIIVISDTVLRGVNGEDLAPIYFGGIYLPLEYHCDSCYKSPMVLAYDSAHFSPLLTEEKKGGSKYDRLSNRTDVIIPLVYPNGKLLPVQFMSDPKKVSVGEDEKLNKEIQDGRFPDEVMRLLETYLMIRWIQLDSSGIKQPHCVSSDVEKWAFPKERFAAAKITYETQPAYQKELVSSYIDDARKKFDQQQQQNGKGDSNVQQSSQQLKDGEKNSTQCQENRQAERETKTEKPCSTVTPKMTSKKTMSQGSPPPLIPITPPGKPKGSDSSDGGYSRDHISAIGLDTSSTKHSLCKKTGCNGVASEALSGYCLNCYPK